MSVVPVDVEVYIRTVRFWAVPHNILDHISFVTYGSLLAYTCTKCFRNGFPQRGPLKRSIIYLIASLTLSFTSSIIWWRPSIWTRVPSNLQDTVEHLWGLSLPLFHTSILEALSHVEMDGQARNVRWKNFLAITLVLAQAATSLPILAINISLQTHLRTIVPVGGCWSGMAHRLYHARETGMRLRSAVTLFTGTFTLVCLVAPVVPSSAEGANTLRGIRSRVVSLLFTSHALASFTYLFRYVLDVPWRFYTPWQWAVAEVPMIVSRSLWLCATVAFVMTLKRFTPAAHWTAEPILIVNETKSGEKHAVL